LALILQKARLQQALRSNPSKKPSQTGGGGTQQNLTKRSAACIMNRPTPEGEGRKGALHKRQAVSPPLQGEPFPPERGTLLWLHTVSFSLTPLYSLALPRCSTRLVNISAKGNDRPQPRIAVISWLSTGLTACRSKPFCYSLYSPASILSRRWNGGHRVIEWVNKLWTKPIQRHSERSLPLNLPSWSA